MFLIRKRQFFQKSTCHLILISKLMKEIGPCYYPHCTRQTSETEQWPRTGELVDGLEETEAEDMSTAEGVSSLVLCTTNPKMIYLTSPHF